jgi:hypothetical protein
MINLILIVLVILLVFCLYVSYRNNKVYYFEIGLSNLLFDELIRISSTYKNDDEFHEDENNYNCIREKVYSLLNKHSYNEYLFSFKSLKLEKWFSKEDLEFMTYLKQYRTNIGM